MNQDQVNQFLNDVVDGKVSFTGKEEAVIAQRFISASHVLRETGLRIQTMSEQIQQLKEQAQKAAGAVEITGDMLIEYETARRSKEAATRQPQVAQAK